MQGILSLSTRSKYIWFRHRVGIPLSYDIERIQSFFKAGREGKKRKVAPSTFEHYLQQLILLADQQKNNSIRKHFRSIAWLMNLYHKFLVIDFHIHGNKNFIINQFTLNEITLCKRLQNVMRRLETKKRSFVSKIMKLLNQGSQN